ncbi:MAG: hypothetical protein ACRDI2_17935 [Chloroflexota bacterium]
MTDYTRNRTTGTTTDRPRFEDYSDRYRSDWEGRYGAKRPWSEHEEGFRYGWHAGQHDRFRDREYRDVESDLERDWPNRRTYYGDDYDTNRGDTWMERGWNDLKEAVREGFERARMEFNKRT